MINIEELKKGFYHIDLMAPRKENDEIEFLEFLDHILTFQQFGFSLKVTGEAAFSPEAKKTLALWFKNNQMSLKSKCKIFVRILTNENERLESEALKKAMPCPYEVVKTKEEAQRLLL